MSCADVCIDMGTDNDNEFESSEMRTARKQHVCCECGAVIAKRQSYERFIGKGDGRFFTRKTCAICVEVRKVLVCGGWYFGQLWEEVREQVFPVWQETSPIDCLAKIESLEARDKLRAEYAEWRDEER